MDVVPYLSTVILISTIATIALAVLSYAAFKLRDKRRPKPKSSGAPVYFHRYRPPSEEGEDGPPAAARSDEPS
jgi:hypothetical protein